MQSRATDIADHILPLGDLFNLNCLFYKLDILQFSSQVITEQDLVSRAIQFQTQLQCGALADFCAAEAAAASAAEGDAASFDADYWNFVGAHFSASPHDRWLELLGFGEGVLAAKAADLKRGIDEMKLQQKTKGVPAASVGEVGSLTHYDELSALEMHPRPE